MCDVEKWPRNRHIASRTRHGFRGTLDRGWRVDSRTSPPWAGRCCPRPAPNGLAVHGPAGRCLFFLDDLGADLLERAPDQPRDVHLRDPDLLRDLRLREPVEEAQVQDATLAFVERTEARLEHGAVLRDLVLVLLLADRLERVELVVPVTTARRE